MIPSPFWKSSMYVSFKQAFSNSLFDSSRYLTKDSTFQIFFHCKFNRKVRLNWNELTYKSECFWEIQRAQWVYLVVMSLSAKHILAKFRKKKRKKISANFACLTNKFYKLNLPDLVQFCRCPKLEYSLRKRKKYATCSVKRINIPRVKRVYYSWKY